MFRIKPCRLPSNALLHRYERSGIYTDCYKTKIDDAVEIDLFVLAFYTSSIFRLERSILSWAIKKPSTDLQAARLGRGKTGAFSAWLVEARGEQQLLLSDCFARTRSWLMVDSETHGLGRNLYFGSAVVPVVDPRSGKPRMGWWFYPLKGFHKLYSYLLLYSARQRLKRHFRK